MLNEQNCTYTEKWYFNGKIYREETRYSETSESAKYDFDIACKSFSENYIIIQLTK